MEQERTGIITREEAHIQLAELGIEMPQQIGGAENPPNDSLADLDEETKTKVQEIMNRERSGELTKEEAQAELAKLDVNLPMIQPPGDGEQPPSRNTDNSQ